MPVAGVFSPATHAPMKVSVGIIPDNQLRPLRPHQNPQTIESVNRKNLSPIVSRPLLVKNNNKGQSFLQRIIP
jgi:hypothetical protein